MEKEDLKEFIRKNWKKIPYLCTLPEESINELLEKETVSTNRTGEYFTFEKRKDGDNEYYELCSYGTGIDEYGDEIQTISSQMHFNNEGNFVGIIYSLSVEFAFNEKGEIEFNSNYSGPMNYIQSEAEKNNVSIREAVDNFRGFINKFIESLMKTKAVATHFGDDLDNKSSIYAVEQFLKTLGILAQEESLRVERIPAGKVKDGYVNLDTGGHTGNSINSDNETIVVDGDPSNGINSASQSLNDILGIYVPEQICKLADTKPLHISPLDSRSGLALVRYLSGSQTFDLAEHGLLDKSLTDEQLEKYGLVEAHEKQQHIIDTAVEKINKYTVELKNGEKMVLAPEQVIAGSSIAYEMGIPYYASISQHFDEKGEPDGVTFAITCKPGTKLPDEVLEYGRELAEEYRIDERTSGVFVNPNGQMVVAGGPKNPNFKVDDFLSAEEMAERISQAFGDMEPAQYLEWLKSRKEELQQRGRKIDEIEQLISQKENPGQEQGV